MWIDADPVRDVIHELFRRYERAAEEQLGSLTFADLVSRVDADSSAGGEEPDGGDEGAAGDGGAAGGSDNG